MEHRQVAIKKKDSFKQIVYGEVYIPGSIDAQGDYMTAENIEKIAHNFLRKGLVKSIDTEHDLKPNDSVAVESFVARPNDPDFTPGSWVLGVHVPAPAMWDKVMKGEINGFSMYGTGYREDREIEIEIPDDGIIKGDTFEHGDHHHEYHVKVDGDGRFQGGVTGIGGTLPHTHRITKSTATDVAEDGHSHRFAFIEKLLPRP